MPAVGRIPNQGFLEKISHRAASVHKHTGNDSSQTSPRSSASCQLSNTATSVSVTLQNSTLKESQSQSLPTRRRHSRTKPASHHARPLSSGIPADSYMDCDVVTETASVIPTQERGSVKTLNATQRRQRGTSMMTSKSSFNRQSRSPRTRRLHLCNTPNSTDLDIVASRQESRGALTASNSEAAVVATTEISSVNDSRGFRARLMLSQARKTIENHKPAWSDTDRRRGYPRTPFVMDIVLELKSQYAGYTTEDMYVTFEAMRRTEDARPVFEHLAHDFSAGVESVDAYWHDQAKIWQDWRAPADECIDSHGVARGSPFPAGHSLVVAPGSVGVYQRPFCATVGTPPSNSLSSGRTSYPDSIERSTASWCPVLECDYVASYPSHPQYRS